MAGEGVCLFTLNLYNHSNRVQKVDCWKPRMPGEGRGLPAAAGMAEGGYVSGT